MRLGGWSRIGIVLSVIYGGLVVLLAWDGRPTLVGLEEQWFDEAAEVIASSIAKSDNKDVDSYRVRKLVLKYDNSASNIELLKKIAESPSERQKVFSADIALVNKKFTARIAELPAEQRKHFLFALVWWFGGVSLLFGTGWTVRWVYRGFSRSAA